jgi:hypothetical protein
MAGSDSCMNLTKALNQMIVTTKLTNENIPRIYLPPIQNGGTNKGSLDESARYCTSAEDALPIIPYVFLEKFNSEENPVKKWQIAKNILQLTSVIDLVYKMNPNTTVKFMFSKLFAMAASTGVAKIKKELNVVILKPKLTKAEFEEKQSKLIETSSHDDYNDALFALQLYSISIKIIDNKIVEFKVKFKSFNDEVYYTGLEASLIGEKHFIEIDLDADEGGMTQDKKDITEAEFFLQLDTIPKGRILSIPDNIPNDIVNQSIKDKITSMLNLVNKINAEPQIQNGGGQLVHILGRNRKIVMQKKVKYVMYNKELITLTSAKKLDKKVKLTNF